jgi:hypothetical protein
VRSSQRFLDARQEVGEKGSVKFDVFQKLIAQQAARILAQKGATAVDFRLETKDGKVSLKAKPVLRPAMKRAASPHPALFTASDALMG